MSTETQKSSMKGIMANILKVVGLVLLAVAIIRAEKFSWEEMVWFVAFMGSFLIRTPHALKNQENKITEDRNDGLEKSLLFLMFLTMMIIPLVYVISPYLDFANYTLPVWASVIGALLQVGYLWLFWRSHADLDKNWSPALEIRQEHSLVTNGIYRHIRHPMYAGIWLAVLSQPLLLHNWIAGIPVILTFWAMWIFRIPKEEGMMIDKFGNQYRDYMTTTGRIIPKFGNQG